SINEGGATSLTGVINDLGTLDTFSLVVNWGDGTVQTVQNLTSGQFSINHTYRGTLPGQPVSNFTASVNVTDDDLGAAATTTAVVTVNNVAPTLSGAGVSMNSINENGITVLTGTITDPGVLDTFSLVVNWGDGAVQTINNLTNGIFSVAHRYRDN